MMTAKMKTPAPGKGQAQSNNDSDHSTHPYLERKEIELADLQLVCKTSVTVEDGKIHREDAGDWLGSMIFRELVDAAGAPAGFERILPERIQKTPDAKPNDKFVTRGSKVSGTFTPIGFRPIDLLSLSGPLVVCAGLADGYSIHLATGYPVACCVGEMSVGSVVKVLRTVAGRAELLVAVDNDDAGHRAAAAAGICWTCPSTLKDWSDVRQQEGIEAVWEQLKAVREAVLEVQEDGEDEGDSDKKEAQSDKIVAHVIARNELFHDDNDVAYTRSLATGEVRPLASRSFRNWLTADFYSVTEKAVRDQSLREARMTLEGMAMQDYRAVHTRVAGKSGDYWLDLGESGSSRAVHVRPGNWTIEDSELMFCRSDSAQPLVDPLPGGDLGLLWEIANVPPESRLLVVAWLVECLRPDTPFPVLELLGEHGSAKSTAQAAMRRIIDPNAADLRGAPKSAEDLFVSGGVNHVISLENVSYLTAPIQDAICVVATGGGFARRKLYTDGEETVITLKRPVVLNGIAASVTQQDLVSRTITVEMPVIESAQARDKLESAFEANRQSILGGLLDIAARALEHLPDMTLPPGDRPRLVEFAYLGMAVAKAMGRKPEEFVEQFKAARQDGLERTLDASPVATAIRDWAEIHPGEIREISAKEWLHLMESFKPVGCGSWPRSAKGLGDAMRRAAPSLRQLGIECRCLGKGSGGVVRWRIGKKVTESMSPMSRSPKPASKSWDIGTSGTSNQGVILGKIAGEEF